MSNIEGLQRPEQIGTKTRERREGTEEESKLLAAVGERLKPDSLVYAGSFASHIYYHPLAGEYIFMSQSADLRAPEQIANEAIKELARKLMIQFGRKPPRKIGESNDI